jgi:hypothetical protein
VALSRIAWYPVLAAVAFVAAPLSSWDIPIADAIRPLAVALAIAVPIVIVFGLSLGRDRGAALSLVLIAAAAVGTTPQRAFILIVAGLAIMVDFYLDRRGRPPLRLPWPSITRLLSLITVVVVVLQLLTGIVLRIDEPVAADPSTRVARSPSGTPDIYVLLVDGHGRSDVLQRTYGQDESAFERQMIELGFVAAPASRANHTTTLYSLSVLLNGRPLRELGQDMSQAADESVPPAAIRRSSMFALARGVGYDVVALESGYSQLRFAGADVAIDVGPLNEFEETQLAHSALGMLIDGDQRIALGARGDRVIRQFDEIKRLAAESGVQPRLVFAHVPSPHAPYVLDSDCRVDTGVERTLRALREPGAYEQTRAEALREQTTCVDLLILDAARSIATSDPSAVILVLSDHGPSLPVTATEAEVGDRLANLFFARTPNLADPFPQDVTLVNAFPILFNALWGTGLQLNPNDVFVGPSGANPGFRLYQGD